MERALKCTAGLPCMPLYPWHPQAPIRAPHLLGPLSDTPVPVQAFPSTPKTPQTHTCSPCDRTQSSPA